MAFTESISSLFFIQQLTERVEADRLNRAAVQLFETLNVVGVLDTDSQRMRGREVESDVQYGEDTSPEPLLDASLNPLLNPLFNSLLDALPGEVLGKG